MSFVMALTLCRLWWCPNRQRQPSQQNRQRRKQLRRPRKQPHRPRKPSNRRTLTAGGMHTRHNRREERTATR